MTTQLTFLCDTCNQSATILKVVIHSTCKVVIFGECATCDKQLCRTYDITEILFSQEDEAA